MTEASFIGDEWHCRCGNQPHTNGFYPCMLTGEYVDPATGGEAYRCAQCNAVIQIDEGDDVGMIVGQTEARFLDQPQHGHPDFDAWASNTTKG